MEGGIFVTSDVRWVLSKTMKANASVDDDLVEGNDYIPVEFG